MDATREARRPRAPGADLPPGVCRYCTKPTGTKRGRAHDECRTKWRTVNVPDEVRDYIFARDHYRCIDCGRRSRPHAESELQVDHDHELADGGKNDPRNLVTRCIDHHAAKTQERRMARTATATPTAAKGKVKPPVTGDLPDAPQPPWGFVVGVVVVTALGWLALNQVDPARASRPLFVGGAALVATLAVSAWRLFRWHRAHESKRVYDRLCKQAGTAYAQRKHRWKVLAWSWITPTSVRLTYGDDFKDSDPAVCAQLVETFARAIDVPPAQVAHKIARGRITMTFVGERAPARAEDPAQEPPAEPREPADHATETARMTDALNAVVDGISVEVTEWHPDGAPAALVAPYPARSTKAVRDALGDLPTLIADVSAPRTLNGRWAVKWDSGRDRLLARDEPDPLNPTVAVAPREDNLDLTKGPVIGIQEDGTPWRLPLLGTHIYLCGQSGSGKGSILWNVVNGVWQMILDGRVVVYGSDPKGGMELGVLAPVCRGGFATAAGTRRLLQQAAADTEAQAQRLAYARLRKLEVPTVENPLRLVIVDEIGAPALAKDKDAVAALEVMLQQGRAVGTCVIGALQDPRIKGLDVRPLFKHAIALSLKERAHVDMVLGAGARASGARADEIDPEALPGVGYVAVGEGKAGIARVRAAYFSDAMIEDLVHPPKPVEHTPVQSGPQLSLVKEDPEPEPRALPAPPPQEKEERVRVRDLKKDMRFQFDDDPDTVTVTEDAVKRGSRVLVTYRYDGETGDREFDFEDDDTVALR